jgi:cytochrome P450
VTVPVTPAELGYAPANPAFIADPYPVFERLRADHPVIYDPATNQWLVSRFADVGALLRDRLVRPRCQARGVRAEAATGVAGAIRRQPAPPAH